MTSPSLIDDLVRAADPAPVADRTLDPRARADLTDILASTAPGRPARHRLLTVAAAAIAVLLVAAGAVAVRYEQRRQFRQEMTATGIRATPEPLVIRPLAGPADVGIILRELAARVAQLPDDTGTGRYARVATRGWYLHTQVDGVRVTSKIVETERTTWRAADGSGRLRDARRWPSGEIDVTRDDTLDPGGLASNWPAGSLTPDDSGLAAQLAVGHPARNGPAERLVALADAYREMAVPPAVRAAMLRYLAATDTLVVGGEVVDRAGRPGLAFSLDSAYSGLPTRYTVIVDRGTGHLLGFEQMLTTDAGKLDVPVPSVISYDVFLSARFTDHLD